MAFNPTQTKEIQSILTLCLAANRPWEELPLWSVGTLTTTFVTSVKLGKQPMDKSYKNF